MVEPATQLTLSLVLQSRKEILKIHTAQWKPRPSEDFLDELADRCVGKTIRSEVAGELLDCYKQQEVTSSRSSFRLLRR